MHFCQSFPLSSSVIHLLSGVEFFKGVVLQCWYVTGTLAILCCSHLQVKGEWKGVTAGGCGNYPDTHRNNPIYQVKIDNNNTDNQILIELKGPK